MNVSIIIPIKNSAPYLEACLKSIRAQTYTSIEIILVDSQSRDKTAALAKKYRARIYQYKTPIRAGRFEAPYKRNYGAKKAKGKYIYYLDVDMELEKNVIREAVGLIQKGFAAVFISEDSFGEGIWARAKNLERRCYWGDDTVEAPRFFKKSVWKELGGLDEKVGGGGDDWDLYQKLLDHGYKAAWTKSIVYHNEGHLTLGKLMKKRFMYGKESLKYIVKRPRAGMRSYFPFRPAYMRHWRLFVTRPVDALAFFIMRTAEYSAGFAGVISSLIGL